MNKIAIVGISGSGKSTLANRLGQKLNLPVFHLDKYYWTTGWKLRYATKEEFTVVAKDLTNQDKWIIDGNYRTSIDMRFERADTIIFLDFPKWKCLLRVLKRTLNRKQPFDKPEGVKDKVDWALLRWIWIYDVNEMRQRVLKHKDGKQVYIFKNTREVKEFLLKLD
jgi:adenylate kinase family enzyme